MIPLLTSAEMRSFDQQSIAKGVSGLVLMENAGRQAADVVCRAALDMGARRVVVVCGTGNNGGDGFVVARHLATRKIPCEVHLVGAIERVIGDAKANLDAWRALGGEVNCEVPAAQKAIDQADIVVDALFGTGLDREVQAPYCDVIAAINQSRATTISIDVPSGLSADTGHPLGIAVRADTTVTFGHYKLGLVLPDASEFVGEIVLADLGVPANFGGGHAPSTAMVDNADVRAWLMPRKLRTQKFNEGSVLIIAGSPSKTGAALLAARGALRAGAGLVTLATWPEVVPMLDAKLPEVMVTPISESNLDALMDRKSSVVFGPGIGVDARAKRLALHLLATSQIPLLFDADAFTLFSGEIVQLRAKKGSLILTPHAGELARILGGSRNEVVADPLKSVVQAHSATGAIVLLKGHRTLIADADRVYVNPTGHPLLATAGSGDVLAGAIGALCGVLSPSGATLAGAYLHGRAGELLAQRRRIDRGVLASEIADALVNAFSELRQ
jgi:NAD(P)H-hydrate epimerase